ncbi:hypothetical protein [Paraburkholderia diazotrophica]|uniref:hypothetical protein n=1 Tax=Paraburkholderia diazotrophica TaxID=667676 RepID=UPI0031818709
MRHSFTVRAIDARRQLALALPDTVVPGMFVCRLMAPLAACYVKQEAGRAEKRVPCAFADYCSVSIARPAYV